MTVAVLSGVGEGFPDLLAGKGGVNILIELKDPAQDLNKRRLTPAEQVFHGLWRGQVGVAETWQDVVEIVEEHLLRFRG